jgi:triosephosphate isomerase
MSERRTWLVANWKMNGTADAAATYAFQLNQALADAPSSLTAIFCPPTILIPAAHGALPANARLFLGAQDCHAENQGAFTGSISAPMLAGVGARYVILGHSERRAQCAETCQQVRAKAQAALAAGLTPILCVGETAQERSAGETDAVLKKQTSAFTGLDSERILIAYEPVWAIGAGKTPTSAEIASAHHAIKTALGSATTVLYGGSVKSTNLQEILGIAGVSGALIGGASLQIEEMKTMLQLAGKR